MVSGKSPERIASMAGALAEWMVGAGRRCGVGRCGAHAQSSPGPPAWFATVCARDRAQAVAGLPRWRRVGRPRVWSAPMRVRVGSGTVFVYSGQGSQWAGMGRQLLADEPAFAAAIAELEPVFVAAGRVLVAAGARRG